MKIILILAFYCIPFFSFARSVDLISLKSKIKNISEHPSKKVFVFLSATCPCSEKSMAHLNQLSESYKEIEFVAVDETTGMDFEKSSKIFKEKGLKIAIVDDANFVVADLFNALKTPHAFILDEKNEVLFEGGVANLTDVSSATELYLKNALVQISEHKVVANSKPRTLGCYIKRE